MDEDPFSALGLRRMSLEDRAILEPFFRCLEHPLSDYTFANTFIWARPINVHWAILPFDRAHGEDETLCVFANGAGDLTLLMPPIGPPGHAEAVASATAAAVDICRRYNLRAQQTAAPNAIFPRDIRMEYVSQLWLSRFGVPAGWRVEPMGGDYIYSTQRLIDLDGPDLASKRQSRNRFARRYAARTEPLGPEHLDACSRLCRDWNEQVSALAAQTGDKPNLKRDREVTAVETALRDYRELGLTGMVLWAGDDLAGFTLGEPLGDDMFSVIIEKTDRRFVGAAQYIFSEFCRQFWADRPWCNAGDDWGIENLARVKQSYRPTSRLMKFTLYPPAVAQAKAPGLRVAV